MISPKYSTACSTSACGAILQAPCTQPLAGLEGSDRVVLEELLELLWGLWLCRCQEGDVCIQKHGKELGLQILLYLFRAVATN